MIPYTFLGGLVLGLACALAGGLVVFVYMLHRDRRLPHGGGGSGFPTPSQHNGGSPAIDWRVTTKPWPSSSPFPTTMTEYVAAARIENGIRQSHFHGAFRAGD